jgi:heptosyltransferase-1/heptosyltransferase-2
MKVVYLGHHALGDAVMKVPAIRYLVAKFGKKNVYFTVRDKSVRNFLINHTPLHEDNFLIYQKDNKKKEKLNFIQQLRYHKFDYFILPPTIHNRNGKLLYKLSGAKKLIAHYEIHSLPKKNEVYVHQFKHKVLQNLEFIRYFENWNNEQIIEFTNKNYYLDDIDNSNVTDINLEEKYLMIHPGSGAKETHKRYPAQKWKNLVGVLRRTYPDYKIYVSGVGEEEKLAEIITEPYSNDVFVKNIANKYTLTQFMTIIRNCNLFISADCGPTHLASIMKTNMITVFGPTDYEITGPYTHSVQVTAQPKLRCMHCHLSIKYKNKGCATVDCMRLVNNIQVLEAVSQEL